MSLYSDDIDDDDDATMTLRHMHCIGMGEQVASARHLYVKYTRTLVYILTIANHIRFFAKHQKELLIRPEHTRTQLLVYVYAFEW